MAEQKNPARCQCGQTIITASIGDTVTGQSVVLASYCSTCGPVPVIALTDYGAATEVTP